MVGARTHFAVLASFLVATTAAFAEEGQHSTDVTTLSETDSGLTASDYFDANWKLVVDTDVSQSVDRADVNESFGLNTDSPRARSITEISADYFDANWRVVQDGVPSDRGNAASD